MTPALEPGDVRVRRSRPFFFPVVRPILVAFALIVFLVVGLIELGAVGYAYERIGIDPRHAFAILVCSLAGSWVNVPVAELAPERVVSGRVVEVFGMRHVVPVVQDWPATIIAVNVGGAVVPTLVSLYLVATTGLGVTTLVAVGFVAAVVHAVARPVPGLGIAVPTLVPPLAAAAVAVLLSPGAAPALAYVGGSLGTLIGGDLLNLHRVRGLGAPIASIGGAGTFDGIFVTGVLAVLLA